MEIKLIKWCNLESNMLVLECSILFIFIRFFVAFLVFTFSRIKLASFKRFDTDLFRVLKIEWFCYFLLKVPTVSFQTRYSWPLQVTQSQIWRPKGSEWQICSKPKWPCRRSWGCPEPLCSTPRGSWRPGSAWIGSQEVVAATKNLCHDARGHGLGWPFWFPKGLRVGAKE